MTLKQMISTMTLSGLMVVMIGFGNTVRAQDQLEELYAACRCQDYNNLDQGQPYDLRGCHLFSLHAETGDAQNQVNLINSTYRWVYKKHTRGHVSGQWSVEDARSLREADDLVALRRAESYDAVRHDPQNAFVKAIPLMQELDNPDFCN